uniref:Uncharacterized protein n=1 Tax=Arundo donax TaxID=35708 RepID=A0A0A9F3E6_ARUDO
MPLLSTLLFLELRRNIGLHISRRTSMLG